jgi:signal transduction histidine kinase
MEMRQRPTTRRYDELLAGTIAAHKDEVIERWLRNVESDIGRGGRSLCDTELKDGIGDYLEKLAEALDGGTSVELSGASAWRDVAREHALTRVRQGFDIDELVRELILLRRTIFEVGRQHGLPSDAAVANRLADLIGAAIAASVRDYVESRDYQLAQRDAAHVGFITHELRNPLTTATLAVTRLEHDPEVTARHRPVLTALHKSLARLKDLIDEVLLSRQSRRPT